MDTMTFNLATGEERYYSLPPGEAVIAAYAQSRGDWNTWEYGERYSHLVTNGARTVACGDWCAIAKGRANP